MRRGACHSSLSVPEELTTVFRSRTVQLTEAYITSKFGWGLTRRIESHGLARFKAHVQRVRLFYCLFFVTGYLILLGSLGRVYLSFLTLFARLDCSLWRWGHIYQISTQIVLLLPQILYLRPTARKIPVMCQRSILRLRLKTPGSEKYGVVDDRLELLPILLTFSFTYCLVGSSLTILHSL
jgi:hypothetical protein